MNKGIRYFSVFAIAIFCGWLTLPHEWTGSKRLIDLAGDVDRSVGRSQLSDRIVIPQQPFSFDRAPIEAAVRDPFTIAQDTKPAVVVRSPVPVTLVSVATSPTPQAPPLDLQYVGRTTAAGGATSLYLRSGADVFAASEGMILANGYRVESIAKNSVELIYVPSGIFSRIEIPAPPFQEIR